MLIGFNDLVPQQVISLVEFSQKEFKQFRDRVLTGLSNDVVFIKNDTRFPRTREDIVLLFCHLSIRSAIC